MARHGARVTGDLRVGSIVSRALSRKNLILRLETPRFMTEGDTVTVSGIVHNYLSSDKAAQIKLEVAGANLLDAAQQTITISKKENSALIGALRPHSSARRL